MKGCSLRPEARSLRLSRIRSYECVCLASRALTHPAQAATGICPGCLRVFGLSCARRDSETQSAEAAWLWETLDTWTYETRAKRGLWQQGTEETHLRLRSLLVEGQTCVDFGGHTTRDDGENLLAELDELDETSVRERRQTVNARTRRSMAASTCSALSLVFSFAAFTAASMRRAYPGLFAAARMSDGLVVASYRTRLQYTSPAQASASLTCGL